ncbi:SURF1 family protein [Thalassotalea crassostreae]|uniref:SURF1 family protein n=1 Tax=Thalassotalea crassostreae TaxID=1763536 RepID=UPI0008381E52|nr:SURF1 family protein [Thalassotalea crassostreae]
MSDRTFNTTEFLKSWRLSWVVFTLLVFFALIKLCLWQYQRGVEKQHRLERIESINNGDANPLADTLQNFETTQLNDIAVIIDGDFDNRFQFLLDNQTNNGKLGYKVFQVFFDSLSKKHLLVNLGWIEGSIDRNFIPTLKTFSGRQKLRGNIRFIEQGVVLTEQVLSNESWPMRLQQIEPEKISQLINIDLLPFAVYLDTKEDVGYKKNWQPVVMPPEKHQGYALQWLTLAIAWLSLMLWASIKNYKTNLYKNNNR